MALPRQALEIVRLYLASNGHEVRAEVPLIRKEDGNAATALSYYVINRVVTRWTRRHLGVRLTPHKLRHAYGKQCVDRGVHIGSSPKRSATSRSRAPDLTQVSFERTRQIAELFGPPGG